MHTWVRSHTDAVLRKVVAGQLMSDSFIFVGAIAWAAAGTQRWCSCYAESLSTGHIMISMRRCLRSLRREATLLLSLPAFASFRCKAGIESGFQLDTRDHTNT